MDEDVVDLRDRVAAIRRRWRVIALTVLIVVGCALLLILRQTPQYSSSTAVLIDPIGSSLPTNGVIIDADEVATQASVIASIPVAQRVVDDLGLDESPDDLLRDLNVVPLTDQRVLDVTVVRSDPDEAADVANAFASEYLELRTDQAEQARIVVSSADLQELRDLDQQINGLRNQINREAFSIQTELWTELDNLLAERSALQAQLDDNADVDSGRSVGQVLRQAEPPQRPIESRVVRTLALALMAGLMLGLIVAFARERLDDVIRDEERLEQVTSGVPILGRVPLEKGRRQGAVPTLSDADSPFGESFRTLNTNLRFVLAAAAENRPVRSKSERNGPAPVPSSIRPAGTSQSHVDPERRDAPRILVTSSIAGEGKTTVAANLAVMAARSGVEVVLVDGDLRGSTLAERFGVQAAAGLSDALSAEGDASDYLLDTAVDGLRLLTAGSLAPNPSELLAGARFEVLLDQLSQRCALVVIDSAPLLGVADTLELLPHADVVLLVAREQTSHARTLTRAISRVDLIGASVGGLVLNGTHSRHGVYGYGSGPSASSKKGSRRTMWPLRRRSSAPRESKADADMLTGS